MATNQRPGLDLIVKENWYVGGVSDKRAEEILAAMPMDRGNFIVRDSLLPDADYVLSVREGNEIWNYDICIKPNDGCILYKYNFADLSTAIDFYSENRLGPVYLKSLNEPLISDVQPAPVCTIKMASTVSPPRHVIIAPQSLCTTCKNQSRNKDESESPLSPKRLPLCREPSYCNASSISANSDDQDQSAHQLATEDLGVPSINGRPNSGTTLDEVVATAYRTFDVDANITDTVGTTTETEEALTDGKLPPPVELSSSAGQSFSSQLYALETVGEGDNSRGLSNIETNLNDDSHLEEGTGIKETGDRPSSIAEGGHWEEGDIYHSNDLGGGPGEEEDGNAQQVGPDEVEQLNQDEGGNSNEASRTDLDSSMTRSSVVKLASNLQTILAPTSLRDQLSGRRSKFTSPRQAVSMCPDGIQISQGPVPIMAGATGPTPPVAPPVVRPVKPRTISPDDMDLIAGPINTKRSGKKLKRNKSMFERSDK